MARQSTLPQGLVEGGLRASGYSVELVGGKMASVDSRYGGKKVRWWPRLKRDRNSGSRGAS